MWLFKIIIKNQEYCYYFIIKVNTCLILSSYMFKFHIIIDIINKYASSKIRGNKCERKTKFHITVLVQFMETNVKEKIVF